LLWHDVLRTVKEVLEKKINPSLTNFATAHRSQDDMGAVRKGIIEAVN
jgi:hypothetical protein